MNVVARIANTLRIRVAQRSRVTLRGLSVAPGSEFYPWLTVAPSNRQWWVFDAAGCKVRQGRRPVALVLKTQRETATACRVWKRAVNRAVESGNLSIEDKPAIRWTDKWFLPIMFTICGLMLLASSARAVRVFIDVAVSGTTCDRLVVVLILGCGVAFLASLAHIAWSVATQQVPRRVWFGGAGAGVELVDGRCLQAAWNTVRCVNGMVHGLRLIFPDKTSVTLPPGTRASYFLHAVGIRGRWSAEDRSREKRRLIFMAILIEATMIGTGVFMHQCGLTSANGSPGWFVPPIAGLVFIGMIVLASTAEHPRAFRWHVRLRRVRKRRPRL